MPSRAWLFCALSVLLIVNAFVPLAAQSVEIFGWAGGAARLFGIGIVYYVASFALVKIGLDAEQTSPNRADLFVALAGICLALLPLHWLAKGALVPLAGYLIATSRRYSAEWRMGVILAAIAAAVIFGALLLTAFATPLLDLDGAMVRLVTGAAGSGNIVDTVASPGSGSIERVVVLADCSSIRNISQATILWASMTQLFRVPITRQLIGAGLVAMLTIVVINTARIAAYVYYPQHYARFHSETFSSLIGLASLLVTMAIIAWGILREPVRRPG